MTRTTAVSTAVKSAAKTVAKEGVKKALTDRRRERIATAVEHLREQLLAVEDEFSESLACIPTKRRASARNLVHYLALRRQDLRPMAFPKISVSLSPAQFSY